MLFPIKDREDLEKLKELATLQNQVEAVRLQDKLGKQNFHEDIKKLYEPLTDTIKDVSENKTKTISETWIKNTKAISDLNEKVLELMNEKGLIAPYLASSLVNLFKLENKSQFRLRKDHNSTKKNDFLIHGNIPVTPFTNLITFGDSKKSFRLEGDLLKLITNYEFNADHSSPQGKKLIYEFAKEMNYNTKSTGRPITRHTSTIKILESPAFMASGISRTIILSFDPNELCDRLRLLLQEKHAGNNSNLIDEETVGIIDKLLEYK